MNRLDYLYGRADEGADLVQDLSVKMLRYPLSAVETVGHALSRYRPQLVQRFLERLTPSNMIALLSAPDVKTDQTERYYRVPYSIQRDTALYRSLRKPPRLSALALPAANPYLPQTVQVRSAHPVPLQVKGRTLWYLQDTAFKRPKLTLHLRVDPPRTGLDARRAALIRLYAAVVSEQLNENAYEAAMAGLKYSVGGDAEGLTLYLGGYNDSAAKLYDDVLQALRQPRLSAAAFADVKRDLLQDWRDTEHAPAWRQATLAARRLHRRVYYPPRRLLAAGNNLTLKDVRAFAASLYRHSRLRALAHGNLTASEARGHIARFLKRLPGRPLEADQTFRDTYVRFREGETVTYGERIKGNNSCLRLNYVLEKDTAKHRAASRVIDGFIKQPFYSEMRTKQQLGYLVWSGSYRHNRHQLMTTFIIQSASHAPHDLRRRALSFIAALPSQFAKTDAAAFRQLKAAAADQLRQRPKSIAEKASRLATAAFDRDADFERRRAELEALKTLTQKETASLLKKMLSSNTRRLAVILLYAKPHPWPSESERTDWIGDLKKWRVSRTYR